MLRRSVRVQLMLCASLGVAALFGCAGQHGARPAARADAAEAALATVDDARIGKGIGQFRYAGHWQHVHRKFDGRLAGTSSRSFHVGDTAWIMFVGTRVRLFGVRGPKGGLGLALLDAREGTAVNFYAPSVQPHALVYDSFPLSPGVHTVAIAVSTMHDARSSGNYINLDGASTY